MQLNRILIFIIFSLMELATSAPQGIPNQDTDASESTSTSHEVNNRERKKTDYYEFRHVVAEGVQEGLDVCREKFKWDRYNCPKKAFLDVFERVSLPPNKEVALTHSFIAAGIVLSITRACSYGSQFACGCGHAVAVDAHKSSPVEIDQTSSELITVPNQSSYGTIMRGTTDNENEGTEFSTPKSTKFFWRGCDEIVRFAFKVSRIYLDSQDSKQHESSKRINAHNYEAGRLAVRKNMKEICKCHGASGSCVSKTCWTNVPSMSKVGDYIKNQYRTAAKVGAMTVEETNVNSLNRELSAVGPDKMVFATASPDYCYANPELGINGTLGRYCSRAKHRTDGTPVGRSERDSCDRLCTKCGYKVKREELKVERQCDCRFVYCCSVECKRCPHVEDTYRCARHS